MPQINFTARALKKKSVLVITGSEMKLLCCFQGLQLSAYCAGGIVDMPNWQRHLGNKVGTMSAIIVLEKTGRSRRATVCTARIQRCLQVASLNKETALSLLLCRNHACAVFVCLFVF